MPRLSTLFLSAAFLLGACIQVYPPESEPKPAASPAAKAPSKKPDEPKSPFKPYNEVLKDTKPIDGFLKFHLKRDNTLFLELTPQQLDSDFGLMMHYSRGLGDFGVHDGLPAIGNTRLLRFQRVGDKLTLVHRNERFTADAGSPMANSLADNVGHSVVAAFDIKSEQEETRNLVIDVTGFFVSDYANDARYLRLYYGNKPVNFDKNRSYVENVTGFTKNVEIDVFLTFRASDSPQYGGASVSDVRSIPIGMRYSLFALPETPMQPRHADDRVGNFLTAIKDFSRDKEDTWYVRYVQRWRLEKRDPNAELSEPVKPIVYYVDRSVPLEYRKYVKEGIEGWNKAFEAAGFKNAIVAKDVPEDDSTWSAEDMRYSSVRWTAAHSMNYAIGPSQVDPRTGEILNADVLISASWARAWLQDWENLADPNALLTRLEEAERLHQTLPRERAERVCLASVGKLQQLGVQHALLLGLGVLPAGSPMSEEYLGDAVRDLVLHEVGHTLGLTHNFKGSSGIPYDKLQDMSFTKKHGLTLSVMDYGAVNVAIDPRTQGHYWNKEVGTYDLWAIKYAYLPVYDQAGSNGEPLRATSVGELPRLREIAAQAADPFHTYGNEVDAIGVWGVDPLTSTWDLGSDPLQYAKDRAALVARIQPNLESRLVEDGEGYQQLRSAVTRLVFERYIALRPVAKAVGGLHSARDHKGDHNQRLPFTPVPAAKQREAVQVLIDQAFDEDAFEFDSETLNKLAPDRFIHWDWGTVTMPIPLDFPAHSLVASIQRNLLSSLMSPIRIGRMIDNELRTKGEVYTAAALYSDMTSAVWSELSGPRARPINSFRRNLQRAYTDQLSTLMLSSSPAVPEDARSLARLHLKRILDQVDAALGSSGLNDYTQAHLDESKAQIERALNAQASYQLRN